VSETSAKHRIYTIWKSNLLEAIQGDGVNYCTAAPLLTKASVFTKHVLTSLYGDVSRELPVSRLTLCVVSPQSHFSVTLKRLHFAKLSAIAVAW